MKIAKPTTITNFQESLLRVREYLFDTKSWCIWLAQQLPNDAWSNSDKRMEAINRYHDQMANEIFWFESQGIQFEPPEAQPFMINGHHRMAAIMSMLQGTGWQVNEIEKATQHA
jgi:hypothetical protein